MNREQLAYCGRAAYASSFDDRALLEQMTKEAPDAAYPEDDAT